MIQGIGLTTQLPSVTGVTASTPVNVAVGPANLASALAEEQAHTQAVAGEPKAELLAFAAAGAILLFAPGWWKVTCVVPVLLEGFQELSLGGGM
jgi:hypothetical protein